MSVSNKPTTSNSHNQPATSHAYEYLSRALQLLEKPRYTKQGQLITEHSWITGAEAMTVEGTYCQPEDERADAWCTIGVVKAVTKYDDQPDKAYAYCLSVLNAANPMYIAEGSRDAQPRINDRGSWPLVRKLFQRAIAKAAEWEEKNV